VVARLGARLAVAAVAVLVSPGCSTDSEPTGDDRAFAETVERTTCPDAARYLDGHDDVARDPEAPPPARPLRRAADLRAVETSSRSGRLCTVFEMTGPIRGGTTFMHSHESPVADWATTGRGFAQFFEVELRKDMQARVTSGLDPNGEAIPVPATVGVVGRRLMVTLDRSSFAAGRPSPAGTEEARLLDRFRFVAETTVVVTEKRHLRDDLGPGPPNAAVRFEYPPR
jgi:hypothetical protein